MGVEIERKFLVANAVWQTEVVETQELRQSYLSRAMERIVRIRLVNDDRAYLTVKGERVGERRPKFEYPVPVADAAFMLHHLCLRPLIAKRRHRLARQPGDWIVDEFLLENAGLVLAEVEFDDSVRITELPDWIGTEVTADDRYANSSLHARPFRAWERGA